MKELVPSQHLADVRLIIDAARRVYQDPNTPDFMAGFAHGVVQHFEEYGLELGLAQSLDITSRNNQPESHVHLSMVQALILRTMRHKDTCITPEKKEALQQELDALAYVLQQARSR